MSGDKFFHSNAMLALSEFQILGNLRFQIRNAHFLEITWIGNIIIFHVGLSSVFTALIGIPLLVGSPLLPMSMAIIHIFDHMIVSGMCL